MTENVNNEQDEKNRFLLATTSPHIRCKVSVSRIMWAVIFALLLPTIGGIYFFVFLNCSSRIRFLTQETS